MEKQRKLNNLSTFEGQSQNLPLVVDFGASHCPPCRQLEPLVDRLREHYRGRVQVVKVDIGEATELAQRYGVRSVPTLLAFRNGQVVAQQVGFSSAKRVETLFAELVASPEPTT